MGRSSRFFLSRLRNGANYLIGSSRGSDSEPISKAKTPLTPLPQPSGLQNDIFSEKDFASRFRRCSSSYRRTFIVFSLHPLTATLRTEKRHGFSDFLEKDATKNFKVKLIINKIKKNFKKNSPFKTLDDIIDETKLQLIAAIPFSKDIEILTQNGNNLKKNSLPDKIFNAIAERLDEKNVKLLIC